MLLIQIKMWMDLKMIMLSERQKEYRWLLNNTGIICAES